MRKTILSITFLLLTLLLFSGEAEETYRARVLAALQAAGLGADWQMEQTTEFIAALQQERIAPRVMAFVAANLPEDFQPGATADLPGLLFSACLEMDRAMKRGLDSLKARLYLHEWVNSHKGDSQKQRKMLKSYLENENDTLPARYRNKQILRYRKGREASGGANENQHGSGTGPPAAENSGPHSPGGESSS